MWNYWVAVTPEVSETYLQVVLSPGCINLYSQVQKP